MIRITIIIFMFFIGIAVHADQLSKGDFSVSPILMSEVTADCGCSFYYPKNKKSNGEMLIFWSFSEDAMMRINKKLIKLNNKKEKISLEIGKQTNFLFEKGKIKVRGECKTTWVCPEDSSACEVTEYEGILVVSNGKDKLSIPVWGACGC